MDNHNGRNHYPCTGSPRGAAPTTATIFFYIFGVWILEFGEKNGFGYLENVFKCEFECEFYGNFCLFNDLFWVSLYGQPLCPTLQATPIPRPTDNPTPRPTPQSREFGLFEGEYGYLFIGNDYLLWVSLNVFEFEKNMNLKIFGDLLDGQLLCPPPYTTRPTPYPTPRPIPNPREFCFLGGENNVLLNIFEFENVLENETNVHFQDFENGM